MFPADASNEGEESEKKNGQVTVVADIVKSERNGDSIDDPEFTRRIPQMNEIDVRVHGIEDPFRVPRCVHG